MLHLRAQHGILMNTTTCDTKAGCQERAMSDFSKQALRRNKWNLR
jgi:hypothetical protein